MMKIGKKYSNMSSSFRDIQVSNVAMYLRMEIKTIRMYAWSL